MGRVRKLNPNPRHVIVPLSTKASSQSEVEVDKIIESLKIRIHLDDASHKAIPSFVTLIDLATVLPNAIKNVHKYLYKVYGRPPPVRSVTMILESMGGVAYTTGIPLDDMHKEIHVSLDYLSNNIKEPLRFRDECIGVIVHEMVHCWQHNCCGTAPGGLIEGIADYVRLKSGLSPPHWKKTRENIGKHWDEGYQKTAWFLEWLEMQHGEGTISRMNNAMDGVKYIEKEFWAELFGESVGSLWQKYREHWNKEGDSPTDTNSSSNVSTKLDEDEKAASTEQEGWKAHQFQA